MRVDNSDTLKASAAISSNPTSSPVIAVKSTSNVETDNTNNIQKNQKDRSLNTKNISQMNEYDKNNMPVSEKVVIEAIQKANKAISGGNRRFEWSIHEKTNEIVIKVFDSQTNELVREIPNEKILDMVAKMCEMAGILVDERR
jgi:flagellar protein FlaG